MAALLVPPLTLPLEQKKRIASAESFRELNLLRQEFFYPPAFHTHSPLGELLSASVVINLIHDQIIRRSVQLSVRLLHSLGMGNPPVPYAFLQFGSGGRQEQGLLSDQDNGLVYYLPSGLTKREREQIDSYFHLLVASIVQGLEEAGYPPCQGNVICSNHRWHGSVEDWKTMIDSWCEVSTWENVRYLLLASDARLIQGESALFNELQAYLHKKLADHPDMMGRLSSNTRYYHVPLGWFGRLLAEVQGKYRGGVNIKNGLYLPYVNCIRLFALANGIEEVSTLGRLAALREKQVWSNHFCNQVEDHFRHIIGLRLLPALHWQDGSYLSNSYIRLAPLSRETIAAIKNAMKLAIRLQKLTVQLPPYEERLPG